MKVAIAVHGRYHAFDLAAGLARQGCDVQVATTYPAFIARRWLPPDVALRTAPLLEVWRRLHGRFPALTLNPEPRLQIAFAKFAARTLPDRADVFVGWSSACLEAIGPVRARGMKLVIERGSTHIEHQKEVLEREHARLGLVPPPVHPTIVARELGEYAAADAIAVPTRYAAKTFIERGVPEAKMIVNPLGVDTRRFDGTRAGHDGPPRVLFVGGVGVRKGVPRLLDVFASLEGEAELRIVGRIESGMGAVLARAGANVRILGPLSGADLATEYRTADVFCLPSLEEGFGLVVAEAMAAGLPIIASDATAAAELVRPGMDGLTVPAGDDARLKNALETLIADKTSREAMGTAARERIGEFTWDATAARAVAAYRRLIG